LYLETAAGPEHLAVNLNAGQVEEIGLGDSQILRTDGLVVRVTPGALMLAGGTFAESGGRQVRQSPVSGAVVGVTRGNTAAGRGWFQTDAPMPDPDALVGRTLLIEHGDGLIRGWTLTRVENSPAGDRARLHVHEEPGFLLDPESGMARYYQFPRDTAPPPHRFSVSRIARDASSGADGR
jgi:hypothetical protein